MKKILFLLSCFHLLYCTCLSQQQVTSYQNAGDSINERLYIELGGEMQYTEIKGISRQQPVLLFIHGGPGWPQTPQLRYFNAPLTNSFILATWDQRGSGLSFFKNSNPPAVTLNQIIEDAHELTIFLKKKFAVSKILLAGYSWGSIVGLKLAEKYPQDYYAYAGIAQVINVEKGMEIARDWLAVKAKQENDTATLTVLDKLNKKDTALCKTMLDCFMQQYLLLTKYNGALFNPSAEAEEQKAMKFYEDYRAYDWNKGFEFSIEKLQDDLFSADLSTVKELKIPVIFFEGRHDWNVPAVMVEKFEKNISAPRKEMVWFPQSGHGLLYEEPALFNKIFPEKMKAFIHP